MNRGIEMLISFFLLILIIFVSIYIYFIKHASIKTLTKPYYIDILINQLLTIPARAGPSIRYWWEKMTQYLNDLKLEGKIDQESYDAFVTVSASTMSIIFVLIENKVINWKYFLDEYYYKA